MSAFRAFSLCLEMSIMTSGRRNRSILPCLQGRDGMSSTLSGQFNSVEETGNFFTAEEVNRFKQDGFIIVRRMAQPELVQRMKEVTLDHLHRGVEPVELEAEVQYPGAPATLESEGGQTIRRLRQAHARDICFTDWVSSPVVLGRLSQLLGPELVMPLAHHNCVMTKHPRYSSHTGWHQDIRYWSFQRPELVNVWLALDREHSQNGCLRVIPGSHQLTPDQYAFDEARFFLEEAEQNQELIASLVEVELEPGDVVFFHALTLHAASQNVSQETKHSVVFTFRPADNRPIPGSRSALLPEMLLPHPPVQAD